MKKHLNWIILVLFTIMLPTLFATDADASANSSSPNDLSGIIARIFIDLPPYNENYTSPSIPLNVSVHYYAVVPTEHTIIPYEKIGCVYKLDDGDWKNLTLYSASPTVQTVYFGNIDYLEDVLCKYSAMVEVGQEGPHKLTVKIIPDEVSARGDNTVVRNAIVYFNVSNLPSPTPTSSPSIAEFPSLVVLMIALSVSVMAAALLRIRKK